MKILKTGHMFECIEKYGVQRSTLDAWIRRIPLISYAGGTGYGDYHQWTFNQVVGIAVGVQLYKSPRSCALSFVGSLVNIFGKTRDAELVEMFLSGKTHLMTLIGTGQGDQLLLGEAADDRVDVAKTWRELVAYVDDLEKKQGKRLASVVA